MVKKSISLIVCLCSIIIVMLYGLLFDLRLITLIKRLCFSITATIMFGYLLGIVIEKYIGNTEPSTQENKPEKQGLNLGLNKEENE